jgi:glycosyltransferase involved in cell wall biosynthesis
MASTPRARAPISHWVGLLGRGDESVDGVEDYCVFLGQALAGRGVELQRVRVRWVEDGWLGALRGLWRDAAGWRGRWVLLQYTALSWSQRGFPFGVLAVLALLRRRGVRCAVVFHERSRHAQPSGWFGRVRGAGQDWVVCRLYRGAEKVIFVDRLKNIPWLPKDDAKSVFIPIGANIPERLLQTADCPERNGAAQEVAVFCVDGMPYLEEELGDLSIAARVAAQSGAKLRITFLGRGTREAQGEIERAFRDIPVEVSNLGLLDAENVSDVLARCDALLCVRGRLYPSRGSAIAGIACGLPILGYAGAAEGTLLEEAGLMLVPYRDGPALGAALARVLADAKLAGELRNKSVQAQQKYFSWDRIAMGFVSTLGINQR